ncbi:MAG TPA: carboxypeptidase-like regulatory domain-containing protein [Planctomycetota bacterium]|jgi:protocatechuate 3,4-dioxygenase beta subunit|nr:carboxypeptidase-like regulatory domain-containing protein [Planctomycetota bacterium]
MRRARWFAIGGFLLAGVLVLALSKPSRLPRGAERGAAPPGAEAPKPPESILYEALASSPAPARAAVGAPRPKEWTGRIRGRLVMKDSGGPPTGLSSIVAFTGNPEIDHAETIERLGGLDAMKRLWALPRAEAEAAFRAAGGRTPSLAATAGPDGSFEIAAPANLPPFSLEVRSDFARDPRGFTGDRFNLDEAARAEGIVIELEPAGRLAGSIRTPSGAVPVQAMLHLRVETSRYGFGVELDASGGFAAGGLRPGRFEAAAGAEGFSPSDPTTVEIVVGKTAHADFLLHVESYVSGRVVDDRGNAIHGAMVRLEGEHARESGTHGSPLDSTGPQGAFRIGSVVPGKYKVSASAPQTLRSQELEVEIPPDGGREDLRLVLPRGRFLAGRVLDPGRLPARGATVRARIDEEAWRREHGRSGMPAVSQEATTDSRGSFRIEGLEGGPFILEASYEKKGYVEVRGIEPDADGIEIVLGAPGSVSGRVLDADTGEPVRRFIVRPMRVVRQGSGGSGEGGNEEPFDSASGAFELSGLKPGVHDLTFRAEGFLETTVELIEVGEGTRRDGIEVRMSRGRTLSGWVLESGSGAPVPRAEVSWTQRKPKGESPFSRDSESGRAESGANGSFEIRGLAPGSVDLRVPKAGFVPRSQTVEVVAASSSDGVRIELSRGGSVEGFVFEANRSPIEGAQVRVDAAGSFGGDVPKAVTDASGRFRIGGLAPGPHDVRAVVGKRVFQKTASVADGEVARIEFAVTSGACTVSGRVLRGTEGVPGLRVAAFPEGFSGDASVLPSCVTDASGAFLLEGVAPGKTDLEILRPLAPAGGPTPRFFFFPIEIPEEPRLAFDVRLPPGAIEGRVVRKADGSPLPGIEVNAGPLDLPRERRRRWFGASAITDAQGFYRIGDLEPGGYSIHAQLRESEYAPALIERVEVVEGPIARADLALARGGSLAVTVSDPDGKPLSDATVLIGRVGESGGSGIQTDDRGVARGIGLSPGRWKARVWDERFPTTRATEVLVDPEREATCAIRVGRGVDVRLCVVAETGPIPPRSVDARLVDPADGGEISQRGLPRTRPKGDLPGHVTLFAAPGAYTLRLYVQGYRPIERSSTVGETSPQEITVQLTAEERSN